ncbi:hypothetical protein [Dysgonomonas sp. 520]|uniref:hypothetical protein n=1 Tax=Dysgonomonas sp. 520 TaxID=2302931 RepID=UPI0013D0A8C4|nr:hypothetical protein [Dysgonomonas sp. 520]NDW10161.1 hypothetical protein [Dysgonomonas sp. 520]
MKKLFTGLLSFLLITNLTAQNSNEDLAMTTINSQLETLSVETSNTVEETKIVMASNAEKPFSHLGVGLRASTLGYGIEASTNLTKNFKLRGGLNLFSFSQDFSFDMDDDRLYEVLGRETQYKADGKLSLTNGHILVDIHPMNYGIFHFTAGFIIGKNKIKANGYLRDADTKERLTTDDLLPSAAGKWPTLELDKYGIDINDGNINATLELGNVFKPYLGIGIGRSLPKSRVSFMFELGAIYQGDFTIKQNGKKVGSMKEAHDSFADIDDYTKYLKWWPMLNFQLSYRIF